MVSFPHCKINLGLRVLRRRPDGYHDLETVFYPLPLKDVLEIIPAGHARLAPPVAQPDPTTALGARAQHDPSARPTPPAHSNPSAQSSSSAAPDLSPQFSFTASGLPIPGDPAGNLCAKAWHLLKKDFPTLPPVDTWLYKNIPMGAGLGGGSADGAFMLSLLNSTFQLELGRERLAAYALQLGSDCPFFLHDQPCIATGRGEILEPATIDLSGYYIVLIHPGIHISTAQAFSELQTKAEGRPASSHPTSSHPASPLPPSSLKTILGQPVTSWRSSLINDFEAPLCKRYPELQKIKDRLYEAGAVYASMTGSGSAFYGLFPKPQKSTLPHPENFPGASVLTDAHDLPDASLLPGYFFRIL